MTATIEKSPIRLPARFGDHASYNGVYVGLIVDLSIAGSDGFIATVAYRDKDTKVVTESNFALRTLHRARVRP